MDRDIEELLRAGEIDRAAAMARARGLSRGAAELLALAGRHAEGVMVAVEAREWRVALDLAMASGDERIVSAVCEELSKHPDQASLAAAHARIAHRIDVAARVLEITAPGEAATAWYEHGDYVRAGRCFDRAGDAVQAMRAFEQHLSQTPDDIDVADRLAELRAERGDPDGAVRALQSAVRAGAGVAVMRKLVDGLARLGLDGSARSIVRRIRSIDPTVPGELSAYAGALPRSQGAEKRYAGRYRVVREVGSGATGRVLEAVDELNGDSVALKVLTVGDDRSGAFGRFMREAELAQVLDDPTLVRMRALDPEGPTIVYDWMPGGTLADRIGALTVRETRAIATRLLGALEILHRHGVVHRDLKPSNVLFDPAGQARLGDLGAAHLSDLGATVTGGLVGSLPYMAPEQITGAEVSAATDLYAFGCVLFQMLTGELPYDGPDYVTQHLGAPIPCASQRRAALGEHYDALLTTLLAKDPSQRLQQVAEVRRALVALPWTDVDDSSTHLAQARSTSIPPAASEAGARLTPSAIAGRWTDARLGRDVELVRFAAARKSDVVRWATCVRSDLQPVYDVQDDGAEIVAWAEPIEGTLLRVGDLVGHERARVEDALRAAGLAAGALDDLPVVRSGAHGIVVPLRVLAAR